MGPGTRRDARRGRSDYDPDHRGGRGQEQEEQKAQEEQEEAVAIVPVRRRELPGQQALRRFGTDRLRAIAREDLSGISRHKPCRGRR